MQTLIKDETTPESRWEFDASVTACFEDMLARSIPQYETMRRACLDLGSRYVQPGTDIVDLGCSRGEALWPFAARFKDTNRYVGVEISEPMRDAAKQRFALQIAADVAEISDCDLRHTYPDVSASLTLAILTIQFTPIEYRQSILRRIYERTRPGGAFLFVEKILGASSQINEDAVDIYYTLKGENGYTQEQIERKRLSLEGVLVPVTAKWNEELLHGAGFSQVDCFWRWFNFAGWIAIK